MHAKLLSNNQVTNPQMVTIFTKAGIHAETDSDGDCLAIVDGVRMFARSAPDRNLITMFSGWNLKPEATPAQAVALANKINCELCLARAYYREPNRVLSFDWNIDTSAGVTDAQLVANARRLKSVMMGVLAYDTEHIFA